MPVATPVLAWAATIQAGTGLASSTSFTFTVNLTQGWQIKVPIAIFTPVNVSAGPVINVYPSSDGGATFATVPLQPIGLPRLALGTVRVSIKLETGQYAIQVISGGAAGGAATWSLNVNTQEVVTAILNQ